MVKKFYYLLHPRPAYVIGSGSVKNNEINFMAASWVMPVAEDIPSVCLACDREHKTFELIEKYKQFSINVVEDLNLIWNVGSVSGKEVDKVKKFNLKFKSGKFLDVPILENSIAFLETRVINFVDIAEVRLYISEVKNFEGDLEAYGIKEFWKIPLHRGGKTFVLPSKEIKIIK